MINWGNLLRFVSWYAMILGAAGILVLILTGCADDKEITLTSAAPITNVYNTYVTEVYNTNITEEYISITEEYVTNIQGAQVDIVPLCPEDTSRAFPEILLRVNGVLVAYFAQNGSANHARLVIVPENVLLQTTDGRNCRFKIINGQVEVQ